MAKRAGSYWTSTVVEVQGHKCEDEACQTACAAYLLKPDLYEFPALRASACEALAYRIPRA